MLDELGGVEGLGQEFELVAALAGPGKNFYRRCLAAEEDDAGLGEERPNRDGGFDAVDVGHENVREDELGAGEAGGGDGFPAPIGRLGDEAVAVEDLNDGVGDEDFVVDYEDARGRAATAGIGVRGV